MKRKNPEQFPDDWANNRFEEYWIEKHDLLKELNISISTFNRWRRLGLVCSQLGKLCYIRRSELHRFLLAHEGRRR